MNNFHLLLVEDYPANILVATTLLEGLGYTYDLAENGQEAVDKIQSGKYCAVLMDVEMPVFNGYRATEIVRKDEAANKSKHIPIIGMTAHASITDKQKCLDAGMDDYISKPFTLQDLQVKLSVWVVYKQESDAA